VPETNDFPDHSNQTIEYNYDANGNMTRDYNKEIQEVQYNHLNLPKYVIIGETKIPFFLLKNLCSKYTTNILKNSKKHPNNTQINGLRLVMFYIK